MVPLSGKISFPACDFKNRSRGTGQTAGDELFGFDGDQQFVDAAGIHVDYLEMVIAGVELVALGRDAFQHEHGQTAQRVEVLFLQVVDRNDAHLFHEIIDAVGSVYQN